MSFTSHIGRAGDEITTRKLTHVDWELSVIEASKVMRKLGITELLVTAGTGDTLLPVGILTARDIVTRIVAAELDPAVLTAGDIVWFSPADAHANGSGAEKLRRLQESNQDVLSVMHSDGRLAGVLAIDDLVRALSLSRQILDDASLAPRSGLTIIHQKGAMP